MLARGVVEGRPLTILLSTASLRQRLLRLRQQQLPRQNEALIQLGNWLAREYFKGFIVIVCGGNFMGCCSMLSCRVK